MGDAFGPRAISLRSTEPASAVSSVPVTPPIAWQPIETAPKDGTQFWGKVGDDAIAMFWHPEFDSFVSRFNRMTMAPGYTIDDKPYKDHSPVKHEPTHWMPLPKGD